MRNYETKLPEGYLPVYQIDANDKKTIWAFNVASLLLFAVVAVPLFAWIEISTGKSLYELLDLGIIRYLILIGVYIAYIFLHELTHGLAYYVLTRHPLTFGTSRFVAYCGVPNIYVCRKPALIVVLTPFVTYSIVFSTCMVLAVSLAWKVVWIMALAVHVGGCVGDLWVAIVLMTRFRGRDQLLVRDVGPKQMFYDKK